MPGVLRVREELGVVVGPGVDAVEVAAVAVEAVGELLVHRRALAGTGRLARLRGRPNRTVRPVSSSMLATVMLSGRDADAAGSGVAAQQQHVVAAVLGLGHDVAAEDGGDEVALYGDQVAGEEQARRSAPRQSTPLTTVITSRCRCRAPSGSAIRQASMIR